MMISPLRCRKQRHFYVLIIRERKSIVKAFRAKIFLYVSMTAFKKSGLIGGVQYFTACVKNQQNRA
jgi:hypothetical protein